MSLVTVGLAAELKKDGVAVNSLWPRTTIDTAAIRNVVGAELAGRSRTPEIMADAAYAILTKPSREATGNFYLAAEVLRAEGVTDFAKYRAGDTAEEDLQLEFWVAPACPASRWPGAPNEPAARGARPSTTSRRGRTSSRRRSTSSARPRSTSCGPRPRTCRAGRRASSASSRWC